MLFEISNGCHVHAELFLPFGGVFGVQGFRFFQILAGTKSPITRASNDQSMLIFIVIERFEGCYEFLAQRFVQRVSLRRPVIG